MQHHASVTWRDAIGELGEHLRKYYKRRILILVDDYDVPMTSSLRHQFFEKTDEFLFSGIGVPISGHTSDALITGKLPIENSRFLSGNSPINLRRFNSEKLR
jgi:hypothetical protein